MDHEFKFAIRFTILGVGRAIHRLLQSAIVEQVRRDLRRTQQHDGHWQGGAPHNGRKVGGCVGQADNTTLVMMGACLLISPWLMLFQALAAQQCTALPTWCTQAVLSAVQCGVCTRTLSLSMAHGFANCSAAVGPTWALHLSVHCTVHVHILVLHGDDD